MQGGGGWVGTDGSGHVVLLVVGLMSAVTEVSHEYDDHDRYCSYMY